MHCERSVYIYRVVVHEAFDNSDDLCTRLWGTEGRSRHGDYCTTLEFSTKTINFALHEMRVRHSQQDGIHTIRYREDMNFRSNHDTPDTAKLQLSTQPCCHTISTSSSLLHSPIVIRVIVHQSCQTVNPDTVHSTASFIIRLEVWVSPHELVVCFMVDRSILLIL